MSVLLKQAPCQGVVGIEAGVRGQGLGVRGQGLGIRGQGLGVWGQGTGIRGCRLLLFPQPPSLAPDRLPRKALHQADHLLRH